MRYSMTINPKNRIFLFQERHAKSAGSNGHQLHYHNVLQLCAAKNTIHTFFRGMMASTIALPVKRGNTLEEGVTY